jgi:hypothetical protein
LVLTEAREYAPRTALDNPNAREYKNAVVTLVTDKNLTETALALPGKAPLIIRGGNQTQAYDLDGKQVAWNQVAREGMKVDAIYVPTADGKLNLLLEIRQIAKYEAPPPMKKEPPTVVHKNIQVFKPDNSPQFYIKQPNGRSHILQKTANTKAFDAKGQPVALDQVLRNGARVDLILEPTRSPQFFNIKEIRPAGQ